MSRAVDPGVIERGRARILVSGPSGDGKTYGLSGFPDAVYVDPENGASDPQYQRQLKQGGCKYLGPKEGALDNDVVLAELQEMGKAKTGHHTLIIDSLSKLFGNQVAADYERMLTKGRDMEKTFGAEKKGAIGFVRRLIRWADMTDVNLILVCHQKDKWSKNEVIGVTFDAWEKLEYEFSLWLQIVNRRAIVRKTRYEEFPKGESFDWNYEEFSKRYGKTILEKDSKPIQLATSGQVVKLNGLIKLLKLADDTVDKWMDKAGAESFAEFTQDQISKCIQYCEDEISKANPQEQPSTNGTKKPVKAEKAGVS